MMTEEEIISEMDRLWAASCWTEALRLAERAVAEHPEWAELHCAFGDLMQLADDDRYTLGDSLSAYMKAIELDPTCAEAFESVGYYRDVYENAFNLAEEAFRRAIELGAGADSYAGLARVLSEQGIERSEVLSMLDECPHVSTPAVQKMREEIDSRLWEPEST
jgi:tetratricopeptide (TPR) repeat protein